MKKTRMIRYVGDKQVTYVAEFPTIKFKRMRKTRVPERIAEFLTSRIPGEFVEVRRTKKE